MDAYDCRNVHHGIPKKGARLLPLPTGHESAVDVERLAGCEV